VKTDFNICPTAVQNIDSRVRLSAHRPLALCLHLHRSFGPHRQIQSKRIYAVVVLNRRYTYYFRCSAYRPTIDIYFFRIRISCLINAMSFSVLKQLTLMHESTCVYVINYTLYRVAQKTSRTLRNGTYTLWDEISFGTFVDQYVLLLT